MGSSSTPTSVRRSGSIACSRSSPRGRTYTKSTTRGTRPRPTPTTGTSSRGSIASFRRTRRRTAASTSSAGSTASTTRRRRRRQDSWRCRIAASMRRANQSRACLRRKYGRSPLVERRRAMAAYLIADITVHDPDGYKAYAADVSALIAKHGGKYLVRGGGVDVLEGDWTPARLIIVE